VYWSPNVKNKKNNFLHRKATMILLVIETRLHCALVNQMKTYCFSRNTRLNIRQAKAKRIPRQDKVVNKMNNAGLISTNNVARGTPSENMNTRK